MAPNMNNIFPKFALKQLSTFIAIVVIFTYNVVFDKELECSCEEETWQCSLYMILRFCILFFLQLWTEKKCQKTLRCCFTRNYTGIFFWIFSYHIVKALFIGLLWVIYVLIDGDWYVCCHKDQSQLACKDKKTFTPTEHKTINKLKEESWGIGIIIIICALVAALISSLGWKNCYCQEIAYSKVIMDEEENVLEEILTTAAKKQLTNKVNQKLTTDDWKECFNVANELIEKETRPTHSAAAGDHQVEQHEMQHLQVNLIHP